MALKLTTKRDLRMLSSTATAGLEHIRGVPSVIIMTGIINGQCAVEQPQNFAISPKVVGTDKNAEVELLFFNHLATELEDAVPANSIDSWERFGHDPTRKMCDLGSRT
jgi:hypothetical protein